VRNSKTLAIIYTICENVQVEKNECCTDGSFLFERESRFVQAPRGRSRSRGWAPSDH
jgi:hypothetical protein